MPYGYYIPFTLNRKVFKKIHKAYGKHQRNAGRIDEDTKVKFDLNEYEEKTISTSVTYEKLALRNTTQATKKSDYSGMKVHFQKGI